MYNFLDLVLTKLEGIIKYLEDNSSKKELKDRYYSNGVPQ